MGLHSKGINPCQELRLRLWNGSAARPTMGSLLTVFTTTFVNTVCCCLVSAERFASDPVGQDVRIVGLQISEKHPLRYR